MPVRSISRHGLNVSARAACRRRRKPMAPVFVAGACRVFAPGCVRLFKVRTDGSQLRGGLRASTSATNSREVFGHFRRHRLKLQKAAFIVKPHRTSRNLRFVFTTYSLAPCRRRTLHYATRIDFKHLSQFRRRNNGLRLSIAS